MSRLKLSEVNGLSIKFASPSSPSSSPFDIPPIKFSKLFLRAAIFNALAFL
jgi:hypothetical protein